MKNQGISRDKKVGNLCKRTLVNLSMSLQIFGCVSSLIKTDSDNKVRKASAMFCTLLLQGLGQDTIKVRSVHIPCIHGDSSVIPFVIFVMKKPISVQNAHSLSLVVDQCARNDSPQKSGNCLKCQK